MDFGTKYSDITFLTSSKANSTHTHDDRYYTETEMNTKLNTKQSSKWNELLAKNVNGTYTVSNLASYNEIFIGYGYGWKAQMQEGLVIPYSLWKSLSSSGYLIRDATNGQSAYVKRVSDTQISITSQSNTNWNVYVWGR